MVPKDTTITVYPENKSPRQHVLPAECRVYLNVNAVHYHERYWPDPWALKPDRWMGTIGATPNARHDKKVVASDKSRQVRGTLMTFSGGARACLGRKFTQSEYISVLATVLREYRIVLGEGIDAKVVKQEIGYLAVGMISLKLTTFLWEIFWKVSTRTLLRSTSRCFTMAIGIVSDIWILSNPHQCTLMGEPPDPRC